MTDIMKYYSAIKGKDILPFTTTKVDPVDIMLSKINETKKDKYYSYVHLAHTWNLKKPSHRLVGARGSGQERGRRE